jgi:hypothetical protein
MTVPGIGPIISSAMIAAIGSGAAFARGRDFSAWIGLFPKQMSTGDRTVLGRISKRGNGYLRMLFMQAARVILLRPASRPKHGFWAETRMRSNARGYPDCQELKGSVNRPDTDAQDQLFKSSLSACNPRPVHTEGHDRKSRMRPLTASR